MRGEYYQISDRPDLKIPARLSYRFGWKLTMTLISSKPLTLPEFFSLTAPEGDITVASHTLLLFVLLTRFK
jgi:hypothetical protein